MKSFPTNSLPPQSLVLRFMREKRKLSILYVGKKLGMKPKIVDHMENGRRILADEELVIFLDLYQYSIEIYHEMLELKPLNKQVTNHFFLTRT